MFKVSCLSNRRDWNSVCSNNTVNTNTVMKTLNFGTMKRNHICHDGLTSAGLFSGLKAVFFQLYIELMDCCKSWKMSLKTRDCGKVRSKLCNWLFRQFISFEYKCRPMGVIVYIAHTLQAGHFIVSSLWWLTICLFKVTREFSKLFPKKPYCWVSSKTTLKLRSVAITLSTCFVTFI